jgi:hypothetical protein
LGWGYDPSSGWGSRFRPADFKTVDMPPATDKVPPVTPWKQGELSSPEELTFVVGRLLRSIALVLDAVRRFGLRPISSREHGSTGLDRRFGRASFRARSEP